MNKDILILASDPGAGDEVVTEIYRKREDGTVVLVDTLTDDDGHPLPSEQEEPEVFGPKRRAPAYYVGETIGAKKIGKSGFVKPKRILHTDTERNKNGSVPGIRNKAARRMIRKKLKSRFSSVERKVRAAQDLKREVASLGKNSHDRARIMDKVLDLHGEAPEPVSNEIGNQVIAAAVDKKRP